MYFSNTGRVNKMKKQKTLIVLSTLLCAACVPEEAPTPEDTTAPTIAEVTAVTTPARTYTPGYTFNSSEAGGIVYSGDCTSSTNIASAGDNTINFSTLANGTYNNCTIQVVDAGYNSSSILAVPEFTVEWGTKPINDTGQVYCGDYSYTDTTNGYEIISASGTHDNNLDCGAIDTPATQITDGAQVDGDMVRAGQDAVYGRDVTDNDDSDGHAGFSFNKLDANGNSLANQGVAWNDAGSEVEYSQWSCVQDNVTGLVWEVKQNSSNGYGEGLHDADDLYSWYSTDTNNHAGDEGYADNGGDICTDYNVADTETYCNTEAYVARVNLVGYCGFSDWRLPTVIELSQIVLNDRYDPSLDIAFFPNTIAPDPLVEDQVFYWSSTSGVYNFHSVRVVGFYLGLDEGMQKSKLYPVRLVRGGY